MVMTFTIFNMLGYVNSFLKKKKALFIGWRFGRKNVLISDLSLSVSPSCKSFLSKFRLLKNFLSTITNTYKIRNKSNRNYNEWSKHKSKFLKKSNVNSKIYVCLYNSMIVYMINFYICRKWYIQVMLSKF